ncbi:MAG: VOC family protein [Pseudomonadota bacterium]
MSKLNPSDLPTANVSIITLGVDNLDRATAFYAGLGWANTKASTPTVTFFQGHSVVLGLYARDALAEDMGVDLANAAHPAGFRGMSLALNLPSEAAVDAFFNHALACGATPIKRPQNVFWGGYSGYFADPDGHAWEIAYNPFFAGDPTTGQLALQTIETEGQEP